MNSAMINMGVQMTLLCADFDSFGSISRRGTAESYGSPTFSFLSNPCTYFHNCWTNLHSDLQFPPVSLPIFVVFVFLMLSVLTGRRWNLNEVLIFLMAKDVEYFLRYVLVTCTSSFEKYLLSSLVHLLTGIFVFWCLIF
jgi:hypothetical protein